MKILIFGANGQLGRTLQQQLQDKHQIISLSRQEADFSQLSTLSDKILEHRPNLVINAAAYTAVDQAEHDQLNAFLINHIALETITSAVKKINSCLIHYSTDYVFDGLKPNKYTELDLTNPINIYGLSKLKGEDTIINSACNYLILRTSCVYSSTKQTNFANKILQNCLNGITPKIVIDVYTIPNTTTILSLATAQIIDKLDSEYNNLEIYNGVYHLTCDGVGSYYEFAQEIIELASRYYINLPCKDIIPINSEDFLSPVKRPKNSCLDNSKVKRTFGLNMPDWRTDIHNFYQNLIMEKPLWLQKV